MVNFHIIKNIDNSIFLLEDFNDHKNALLFFNKNAAKQQIIILKKNKLYFSHFMSKCSVFFYNYWKSTCYQLK
jgi:hypothetical protein